MGPLTGYRKQPPLHLLPIIFFLASWAPAIGARTASEAQVQCTAKCLLDYRDELPKEEVNFIRKNPELAMLQCTKNSSVNSANCLQCIDVCSKVKQIVSTNNCNTFCKDFGKRCPRACAFTLEALASKPGACPGMGPMLKTEGLQVRCSTDAHCLQPSTKCCRVRPTDRRSYCIMADLTDAEMPPIPPVPRVRKVVRLKGKRRRKELALALDWTGYDLVSLPHPVVFIVQIRTFRGYHFLPSKVTAWVDLLMTCRRSAMLEDLPVGTWYQFRLAATSAKGLRGYSESTAATRLSREPRPPAPPKDLTEGTARIHGNQVDVEISWNKPRRSQTRIDSYKITWAKHYGYVTGETQTAAKYDFSVPLSQTSYTLANLKPGTTYKVEVTSISKYGDTVIKSLPASIFVTTISIPSPASSPPEPSESFKHLVRSSKCMCSTSDQRQSNAIVTKTPYFEKQTLKMAVLWNHPRPGDVEFSSSSSTTSHQTESVNSYLIEWAPKVCVETSWPGAVNKPSYKPFSASVHGSLIYYLTDLQFNCHYILRVLGVSSSGAVKPLWDTCFCTPSCFDVKVKRGFQPPKCGARRDFIPDAPRNLHYEMEHDEIANKYSVRLVWNSFSGPDIADVHSYRVIWGPRLPEPIDLDIYGRGITPLLDMTKAESKVVEGQRRSMILSNLNESTVYIAHVQSVSTHGESAAASIFFLTPGRRKEKPMVKTVMYHIGVHSSSSTLSSSFAASVFLVSTSLLLTTVGSR